MNKKRFEKIGDTAELAYPAFQKQLEQLLISQVEGVSHVLITAGIHAADGLIAGMVTKWGKETIELKQRYALEYYNHGYDLAELLCLQSSGSRGKSILGKLELAFGSTAIAGMQTKGNLIEFINQTSVIETKTKAKEISKAVKSYIDSGASANYTDLVNTLSQAVASSSKAKQIAHDLTIWSYNQGSREAYKNLGVTSVEWMATEDELTCPYCSQANGKIIHIDQPFYKAGENIDGGPGHPPIKAMFNVQHSPLHPYCRCTLVPILDENFEKAQIDKKTKKGKFASVKVNSKTRVFTAEDFDKSQPIPNGTLVLGSDNSVYVVTNDPNDTKVDMYGGGDFDFAYVKPIVQTAKVKKLKDLAVKRHSKLFQPVEPVVQAVQDTTVIDEPEPASEPIKLKTNKSTFPTLEDIPNLRQVDKKLGGSMGAKIVEDEFGNRFVFKKSSNVAHLREEVAADELYRLLGGNAPKSVLYEKDGIAYKFSEYIPNAIEFGELKASNPAMYAKAEKKVRAQIALNAFLANDDAVGLEMGNIMVTIKDGEPIIWNVDNGGSLRFRAQGQAKERSRFNAHVGQLWSYRFAGSRGEDTLTQVFGPMAYADVNESMGDVVAKKKALFEWLAKYGDNELTLLLSERMANLESYWEVGSDLIKDDFKDTYADKFVYYFMDLDRKGTLARLPEFLNQRGDSASPTLEDEDGVKWDNLRGRNSVSSDIADYIDKIGKWRIVEDWATAQYTSSFSQGSMMMKAWVASKRTTSITDYFWSKDVGNITTPQIIKDKYPEPKGKDYDESMTAWHAFQVQMMRNVTMPYVNKVKRTISIVRTEDGALLKESNRYFSKTKDGRIKYRQAPYASASLMKPVNPLSLDTVISAEMPQHRALCFWFMSKRNTTHGILHYENENEVVIIPDKIEFHKVEQSFSELMMKPAKKQGEEAKRIAQLIAEKKRREAETMSEEQKRIENYSFKLSEEGIVYDKKEILSYLELHDLTMDDITSSADLPWNIMTVYNHANVEQKEVIFEWLNLDENGVSKKQSTITSIPDVIKYPAPFGGDEKTLTKEEVVNALKKEGPGPLKKIPPILSLILSDIPDKESKEIVLAWAGLSKKIKEGKPTTLDDDSPVHVEVKGTKLQITKGLVEIMMSEIPNPKSKLDLKPIKVWYNAASPEDKKKLEKWAGLAPQKPDPKTKTKFDGTKIKIKAPGKWFDKSVIDKKFVLKYLEDGGHDINKIKDFSDLPPTLNAIFTELEPNELEAAFSWVGLNKEGTGPLIIEEEPLKDLPSKLSFDFEGINMFLTKESMLESIKNQGLDIDKIKGPEDLPFLALYMEHDVFDSKEQQLITSWINEGKKKTEPVEVKKKPIGVDTATDALFFKDPKTGEPDFFLKASAEALVKTQKIKTGGVGFTMETLPSMTKIKLAKLTSDSDKKTVLKWYGIDTDESEPKVLTKEEKKAATEAKIKAMVDKVTEKVAKKKAPVTIEDFKHTLKLSEKELEKFDNNLDDVDIFVNYFKLMAAEDEGMELWHPEQMTHIAFTVEGEQMEMTKEQFVHSLAFVSSKELDAALMTMDPKSVSLLSQWMEELK